MAKVTNSYTTYDTAANREVISEAIANLAPSSTPFMSAIGKKTVDNVVFSWQTENLPSVSTTGELEGFEISRQTATPTVRQTNVCSIHSVNVTVSGSQEASNPAAKRSEMAHQLALLSRALKRNVESAMCQNVAKETGNRTTARASRSFEAWIETNKSRGTGGADGSDSAAATDGTQRNLTEQLLKNVLQSMYTNGATPVMAIAGAHNKQVISGFSGRASARQMIDADAVQAAVSVYASDYGDLQIVPSNRSRDRSLLLVDPEYAKLAYLRDFQTKDIAPIGDAETKLLLAEVGLEVSEQAHGIIADLTTS